MAADADQILIIGGGLAGLSAALALNEAGQSVRVLERREAVGLETSFANAGMLTPSMSEPWNHPGIWRDLLRYLGRPDAPLLLRVGALWRYVGWGLRFLRFSEPGRYAAAMRANFALSAYSLEAFRALRERESLRYELRTRGTIKVFRSQVGFDEAAARSEQLKPFGLRYSVLDRVGAVAAEPVLAGNAGSIVGALHNHDDETGDAHLFCGELARLLQVRGVPIDCGCQVHGIVLEGGAVAGVNTGPGVIPARRVVLAAAAWSPGLLHGTGLRVSIRPVKGYSVTAPMRDPALMPGMSIIDNELHAAVTPYADRLRLAGTAELAGWSADLDPARLRALWRLLETVNPALHAATERNAATQWCGFRPMAADGVPYVGATAVPGLYLNTGHGYLGWTQSLGSGRLLAQILSGATPDIDPAPYRAGRS